MEERCRTDNKLLYHYTDYFALDGILNKRELRVNNVLNMNDATEMELFISGIFSAVEKKFEAENDEALIERLHLILEEVRKRYFDFSVYAACFSGYRDDASQWERYANRGKGVCLCFRKDVLEKITGGAISLQKVFYQDDMDSHPLVDRIYELLKKNSKSETSPLLREAAISPTLRDANIPPVLREVIREAWRNCASFKHPSFLSENETRLILLPFSVPDFKLKPQYHVAKDRIKKYYPLDLDAMCLHAGVTLEDLIVEVMIGPESTQTGPILRDYLRDLGLNSLAEHVCLSSCPLRSKI